MVEKDSGTAKSNLNAKSDKRSKLQVLFGVFACSPVALSDQA